MHAAAAAADGGGPESLQWLSRSIKRSAEPPFRQGPACDLMSTVQRLAACLVPAATRCRTPPSTSAGLRLLGVSGCCQLSLIQKAALRVEEEVGLAVANSLLVSCSQGEGRGRAARRKGRQAGQVRCADVNRWDSQAKCNRGVRPIQEAQPPATTSAPQQGRRRLFKHGLGCTVPHTNSRYTQSKGKPATHRQSPRRHHTGTTAGQLP